MHMSQLMIADTSPMFVDTDVPLLIAIDDLSALLVNDGDGDATAVNQPTADALSALIDMITNAASRRPIWVLGVVIAADRVPERLRRRFQVEMETSLPNETGRFCAVVNY